MPNVCENNNCYDLFTGLNKDHLSKLMYEVLGPSSDYEKEKVNSYKFIPGSEKINMPINGPWRHKSIKDFLKHFDEGKFEVGILISLKVILGMIYINMQFSVRFCVLEIFTTSSKSFHSYIFKSFQLYDPLSSIC